MLLPDIDHGCEINGTTIDCVSKTSGFYKLIQDLKEVLQGKGLNNDDIDVEKVKQLMNEYKSEDIDWQHLALHDMSRNYSRNGVINLNGNANLLILVWTPGKSSAIHDHADAHCCVKMLSGELIEHLYDFPDHEGDKLQCKRQTSMKRDEVGYINDSIGLHKMSNPLKDQVSVSLHLYTPPYAAMYGCSMYEASNGKRHHVDMSKYYSWQGKLVHDRESSAC
ncbi:CDG1 Cysteine dioxygenase CDG1 [Candida maltosa Xu316]